MSASKRSPRVTRPRPCGLLWLVLAGIIGQGAHAQPPTDLELTPVVSGLSNPVAVRHAGDGSGRLFIVEQAGRIRIFDGDQLLATPFLDIRALVSSGGERGLLGLAFHPDYPANGYFYVNYTEDATPPAECPPGANCDWNTVVARYRVSAGDPNVADPASALRLLTVNQDYNNHNGGNLLFGPDGYLYIGMGDGGSGNDPHCRSQNLDTLLGKMLRVDVDGGGGPPDCDAGGAYTVPTSNPLTGSAGACDEIWSLGLRNPWRWSFDRFTGDQFIGDVGQTAREEISFESWSSPGAVDFGWKVMEGSLCGAGFPDADCPTGTPSCFDPSYTDPILEHDRNDARAITGGYIYRGPTIAGLQGLYVYGDYSTGRIWIATPEGLGGWSGVQWRDTALLISSFGEDEAGELYLAHLGGTIYRFDSPSSIFGDGFEAGEPTGWSAALP